MRGAKDARARRRYGIWWLALWGGVLSVGWWWPTRVYAADASARRRFAAYWRVIYPGSALIRQMWLRAIKRRAEAAGSRQGK